MTQATGQTFRVFVSSTPDDLKAERDALQSPVLPRLRKLCEKHDSRFQPIELRFQAHGRQRGRPDTHH
jgi:hypothetical protein